MTLLVLPLTEVAQEARTGQVGALLREHSDDVVGFVLSFVVIAQLWLAQHSLVSTLVRQNSALLRLLLGWSFTIVCLPFATALVTATTDDPLAKVLYIGTMAVSSTLLALTAWVMGRDRSLRDTDEKPDGAYAVVTTILFLLALALSLAFPALSYWPLLLLVLTDVIVERLWHRRGAADRAGS